MSFKLAAPLQSELDYDQGWQEYCDCRLGYSCSTTRLELSCHDFVCLRMQIVYVLDPLRIYWQSLWKEYFNLTQTLHTVSHSCQSSQPHGQPYCQLLMTWLWASLILVCFFYHHIHTWQSENIKVIKARQSKYLWSAPNDMSTQCSTYLCRGYTTIKHQTDPLKVSE